MIQFVELYYLVIESLLEITHFKKLDHTVFQQVTHTHIRLYIFGGDSPRPHPYLVPPFWQGQEQLQVACPRHLAQDTILQTWHK